MTPELGVAHGSSLPVLTAREVRPRLRIQQIKQSSKHRPRSANRSTAYTGASPSVSEGSRETSDGPRATLHLDPHGKDEHPAEDETR